MEKYSIDQLKGKHIAVHCPTKPLFIAVVALIGDEADEDRLFDSFNKYTNETCVKINADGQWAIAAKPYFENLNYLIISAQSFIIGNIDINESEVYLPGARERFQLSLWYLQNKGYNPNEAIRAADHFINLFNDPVKTNT